MADGPRIEHRSERAYAGMRQVMPMSDFDRQIPVLTDEVAAWIADQKLKPAGPSFLRYHVIDMPQRMDVELGIPVDNAPTAGGSIKNSILPSGWYAILTCKGVKESLAANKKLLDWIVEQSEVTDSQPSADGEMFRARCETFLTDANEEPDRDQWAVEVAIKLRD